MTVTAVCTARQAPLKPIGADLAGGGAMRYLPLVLGLLMLLGTAVDARTEATCPKKCIGPRGARGPRGASAVTSLMPRLCLALTVIGHPDNPWASLLRPKVACAAVPQHLRLRARVCTSPDATPLGRLHAGSDLSSKQNIEPAALVGHDGINGTRNCRCSVRQPSWLYSAMRST